MREDLTDLSIGKKLELARALSNEFVNNNEIIFIEDQGSIFLPNTQIADWFRELISFPEFNNRVCFCVISRYKPNVRVLREIKQLVCFRISELSPADSQILFLQFLRIMKIDLSPDDKSFYIKKLNGVPAQAIFAANLIAASDAFSAKDLINDIESYSDQIALSIFDYFSNEEHTLQVLILLSRSEIFSYDLLAKIFEDEDKLRQSLQALYDLSAFNFMFSGVEYLKLNTAIADYITRSRLQLNENYEQKMRTLINDLILEEDLERKLKEDYSEFLLTLQNMVLTGKQIPKKFFLPSYILKTIVQKYYDKDYAASIKMAERLLENSLNYDSQIIRETKYWLCQSYARNKNEKFYEVVQYFKQPYNDENKDYYFLLGFYHRCVRNLNKAEEYYKKVLEIDDQHSRTKRELVIVYSMQGEYQKALGLARDNYYRYPTNIYHAQAYFTCLIKSNVLYDEDYEEIREIMEIIHESLNPKASEMYEIMRGEFEFYINHDMPKAISILKECLKVSDNKVFAYRSLFEIFRKQEMHSAMDKLREEYGNSYDDDSED